MGSHSIVLLILLMGMLLYMLLIKEHTDAALNTKLLPLGCFTKISK